MNLKKYGSPNFFLTEFVSKEVYERLGNKAVYLLDVRLFVIVQLIRMYIGMAITVNNWHGGGKLQERGYRLLNTSTGSDKSYHKLGKAVDISWDFDKVAIDEVFIYLHENDHLFKELGLGAIGIYEWGLHLDTRELVNGNITVWNG